MKTSLDKFTAALATQVFLVKAPGAERHPGLCPFMHKRVLGTQALHKRQMLELARQ